MCSDDGDLDVFFILADIKRNAPPFSLVRTRPFDEPVFFKEGEPYPPPAWEVRPRCS